MITYTITTPQPESDLKRIVEYLLTFTGEIQVKTHSATAANIFYSGIKLPSTLTLQPKQIRLNCSPEDNLSVTLIRNLHLRIYNPRLKAFIPNDPNILEVNQSNPIFHQYHLTPIFRYNHSLVFFCRDSKGKIHLINRHLLEYLNDHPSASRHPNFSLVVAKNIGQFIALVDRGLIPLNYYQYSKIINQTGIKLTPKTILRLICFVLDETQQTFIQTDRELTKIPQSYLAVKISPDINYGIQGSKLIPQINVSVFLK